MKIEKDTIISHYKILSEIGKGGMGEVYLAKDTKLNRQVAIKFLGEEFSKDSDKLNRFVQEAQSASALNHPNIITVFEIGETDNTQYIALEYIEGETLTARLKKKLKFNTALDIATQIASALDAAHSAGIVHRDIKPDNVMIRKDGFVKILDFGIAKLTEQKKPDIESEDKTAVQVNTTPGMIIGTANYMSPEQAKGKEVDARTDVFSFGVVLYEMITGRLPFEGESPLEIIGSILNKEPKPIDNSAVPAEVERIISKTLRKDRNERYQTIKDVLIDLKDAKQDLEFQDKLDKTIQPSRDEQNTQMFKATTAAEAENTTASGINDSITIRKSSFSKVLIGSVVILVIASVAASGFYWFYLRDSPGQIESIAVIPFVNESGDVDLEYLSDGMTETLINSLSQVPDLKVKAGSLVFRYKGKVIDPKTVSSELGVQVILTGRVIQRGDRLTLSVELIDGATENTIWGNKYERKGSDLVSLQSEVARDVSSQLKSRLSGADIAKVEKSYTANAEAYQLYLKGKFAWNKRTSRSLKQATEFYDQAIEKDPNYAVAYAGLAETYVLFSSYDVAPAKDSMPQAKAAALRALEIDESLAEAHTALGFYLSVYDWDRAGAEKEYRRAIELKPEYATAHQWYGGALRNVKRFDESIAAYRRAEALDPLSPIISTNLGDVLVCARRYEEAIAQYKRTIIRNPDFSNAHRGLAQTYGLIGRYTEAVAEARKAIELREGTLAKGYLGMLLAKSGKRDEALKVLGELEEESTRNYVQGYTFALVYIGLGDKAKALDKLEEHMLSRAESAGMFAVFPELDDLRSEPRFKAMLKRLNLPE